MALFFYDFHYLYISISIGELDGGLLVELKTLNRELRSAETKKSKGENERLEKGQWRKWEGRGRTKKETGR